MKKKIKYLIFLVLLLFPISVFAAGSVTVSTSSISIEQGGTKTFNIVANNAAGKVTISSNNASVATVDKSSEWVENSTLAVTVTAKSAGSATISVVVDAATFSEEVIKKTYTIAVTVTPPKSTNNKLSGLYLSAGTLSPAFNSDTLNYTAIVHAGSVAIDASKGENNQTISGLGNKTLNYGENTFNIVVKSHAGTTRTYTLKITRPDNRSTNNYLKSLSVDVGTIKFSKKTNSYSLKVGNEVSTMKISAAVEDAKASFASGFGPRTVNLKYGSNSVVVKVKAENGSTRSYTIKVEREDIRSTNNNLSSIKISEGTLNFSKDIENYDISVPYTVDKIDVTALAEDSKAKVEISNPTLVVGNNTITITVTSENETKKFYVINVRRLSEADTLSENNNVSSINILGHGIEFDPSTKEYEIEIGDEYALVIEVLLEDPTAKYVVEGNEDLKDGSVIKVTSTSESGAINEYKINVNKALKARPEKTSNSFADILIGFVLGALVMFFTMLIINKIKKDKISFKSITKAGEKKDTVPANEVKTVEKKVEPKAEEVKVEKTVVEETKTVETEKKDEVVKDPEVVVAKPAPTTAAPVVTTPPSPTTVTPVVTAQAAPTTVEPVLETKTASTVEKTVVQNSVEPVKKEIVTPAPKPIMQEADVKQPYSQELNQIPENKTE